MRTLVGIALLLVSSISSAQWYVGGTLHSRTLKEWHAASTANKHATLADMVGKALNIRSPDAVRFKVVEVAACMDVVAAEKSLRFQPVPDMVVGCMMQLGYLK